MPVMNPSPAAPEPLDPQVPKVLSSPSPLPIVDTRETPLASLLQYVEGRSWVVNYYSQVLGADDASNSQSQQQSPLHQQYTLIRNFEIKVSESLSQAQNQETTHMEIRGSGVIYAAVTPNVGDMFIADVGDGRAGVFSVTESKRMTMRNESYFEITYVQKHFLTDSLQDDFDRKVIKATVFVKDYLHFGQNPQVLDQDYQALREMDSVFVELLANYMHDFFSREHQTLVIPGQLGPTYDPFLTKALREWITPEDHPDIVRVTCPSVESDPAYNCYTVWDCLSKMSADFLPTIMRKASLVPTTHFRGPGQYGGIYFTRLEYVVYPFDDRNDVDSSYDASCDLSTVAQDLRHAGRRYKDLTRLIDKDTMEGFEINTAINEPLPDIAPVIIDDYYVFSEGFYRKEEPHRSKLEVLTGKALRREKLDKPELLEVAERAHAWSNLERYYYVPVLLALMKTSMRVN